VGGLQPYSINWSNLETATSIYNLSEGTYSVTVTDMHACEATNNYTVYNDPSNLNIDTALAHHINCDNTLGWIDLTYSGGSEPVNINWSNGETEEDPEDLNTGIYSVTITDANGCVDNASAEIFDYNNFEITDISIIDDTCSNYYGSININTNGGMQPLNYLWSSGLVTEDIDALSNGYYQCTITTADGCQLTTGNLFVDNIDGFDITAYITHSSCSSCNDGEIDVSITGNGTNYTFNWSNGEMTEDLVDLLPNSYDLGVTNDLGCHLDTTFTVSFNSFLNPSEDDIHITAYPNPTKDMINIEYDSDLNIEQIRIVNILGQEVLNININSSQNKHAIDLKEFAFGTYQVQLISKYDVHTLKVVHQKE
jgi:hypothetical protein